MKSRLIKATDLKTEPDHSTPVTSNALKFIIPVPNFGPKGEPLVYPAGDPKAGQPILDHEGKPIGGRGIVFFNYKDQSWQAAPGDGQSVLILNEVTQQQAETLHQTLQDIQPNLDELRIDQLKQVLTCAKEKLDLQDMYNSTRSFIRENMTSVGMFTAPGEDDVYGLKKRNDSGVSQAIYIPGSFEFDGPTASPQVFTNGGVIVKQGDQIRGVQPDVFVRTYTLADGRSIKSVADDIKSQKDS